MHLVTIMVNAALFSLLLLVGKVVAQPPWEGPDSTDITLSAAANLPDGNIIGWSAWSPTDFSNPLGIPQTATVLINPFTKEILSEVVTETNHDMFCPGTAILPNGLLMVTGGTGNRRVSFYDYTVHEWKRGRPMVLRRGYHSMTVLGDGSVFSMGGSWLEGADGAVWDKYGELFKDGEWIAKPGIPPEPLSTEDRRGPYRADNHMWLFTAPNGLIFHAGPAKRMHWIDVDANGGEGGYSQSLLRGNDGHAMNGNAVMYDIGLILTCGGAPHYNFGPGTSNAFVININGGEGAVTVTQTGSMNRIRTLQNSVVMPDGKVVTFGGQIESRIFTDIDSVYEAEIWDPVTGDWTLMEAMQIPRNYHAVALLMQDARVFVSGSGLCGDCGANHPDFEVFTPPYLRTGGARPVIESSTEELEYLGPNVGTQDITVRMTTFANHEFSLMRLSAATHTVNNDMRRIPLRDATRSGKTWTIKVPGNRNISIPGTYWLFAINNDGVPSVGVVLVIHGEDNGPYTPPPEPTASPSGITCFPDCDAEQRNFWICPRTWGCEGCPDTELTCERLCRRCEGRDNNLYAGLDCNCPGDPGPTPKTPPAPTPTPPPADPTPTPPPVEGDCWDDCTEDANFKWICRFSFGCEACPFVDTCDKLCSRCAGEPVVNFGGLPCDCEGGGPPPTTPPPPPTAPPVDGPCFGVCGFETKGKWICDNNSGCQGCDKESTCEKLCNRCDGLADNRYGGLDCDCPDPEPVCQNVCGFQEKGKWICDNASGCQGCDKQTTCEKLCNRCDGLEGNRYGGLDCECQDPNPPCLKVCGFEEKGKWICDKDTGCQGCDVAQTCSKLCDRCDGRPGNQFGGLNCNCA